MGWYQCVKTVKGHRYLYLQMSYREGGKVKTKSKYLGPVSGGFGKSTVTNLPVSEGSRNDKPAGGLKIDKIKRAKHLKIRGSFRTRWSTSKRTNTSWVRGTSV